MSKKLIKTYTLKQWYRKQLTEAKTKNDTSNIQLYSKLLRLLKKWGEVGV